jgi:chemotaxis protein CheX
MITRVFASAQGHSDESRSGFTLESASSVWRKKMDARFINPFLIAVQNIFETMIDVNFKLGKPSLKKDTVPSYEVSGIIGLSGSVSGCVVLNLSKDIALQLASALLDEKLTEVNEDCTDAIGEIANMIAGNAKTDFPVENTSISVPSVVIGKHKITYPSGVPIVSIPCETSAGRLVIDIALKDNT